MGEKLIERVEKSNIIKNQRKEVRAGSMNVGLLRVSEGTLMDALSFKALSVKTENTFSLSVTL